MITKLTEQKGCIIAEFIDLKRFTLAVTGEVKSESKVSQVKIHKRDLT